MLQMQNAGLFLGQIEHPTTGERSINLRAAKSVVDSLEMLKNKTVGNLTDQEATILDKAIVNIGGLYKNIAASQDEDDCDSDKV